jgi:hypothetical protein
MNACVVQQKQVQWCTVVCTLHSTTGQHVCHAAVLHEQQTICSISPACYGACPCIPGGEAGLVTLFVCIRPRAGSEHNTKLVQFTNLGESSQSVLDKLNVQRTVVL